MKVWRKQIKRFLDWHPLTAAPSSTPVSIAAIIMGFTLPALIYFVYPHFDHLGLKSFLNAFLSPVILILSWYGASFILLTAKTKYGRIISFVLFIPFMSYLSMILHLHWVVHYPLLSVTHFLLCLSGVCFGVVIAYINLLFEDTPDN